MILDMVFNKKENEKDDDEKNAENEKTTKNLNFTKKAKDILEENPSLEKTLK
jgi:hypothetical protein